MIKKITDLIFSFPGASLTVKFSIFVGASYFFWRNHFGEKILLSQKIAAFVMIIVMAVAIGIVCVRLYQFVMPKIPEAYRYQVKIGVAGLVVILICLTTIDDIRSQSYFDVLSPRVTDYDKAVKLAQYLYPGWLPDLKESHTTRIRQQAALWGIIILDIGLVIYLLRRRRKAIQ